MINIKLANKFLNENKDKIFDLYVSYQMIEIFLFLKLHLPEEKEREDLEGLNKKLDSKTLGMLTAKYMTKFPDDKYDLKDDLEIIKDQRNNFVHSFAVVMALGLDEDEKKWLEYGDKILNDSSDKAGVILDKLYKLSN